MASKIDISSLTLNAEEASNVSSVVLEREFVNGVLSDSHMVETGIEHNKQIVFAGKITDSLKLAAACAPAEGGTLGFSEKFWTPKTFTTRFKHCAGDLSNLVKIFKKAQRMNPDFYDRIASEEMGMVAARVGVMLREVLPVKAWFSDTAAALHSGAGVFSTGTDLTLYSVIDGIWKQVFAEISSGDSNYIEIAENSLASYALQKALGASTAYDTFEAMVNAGDERLVSDVDARFYVTRSLADNYRDYLRSNTLGAGFTDITENGKRILTFDGYQIEVRYDWDRIIRANQDNGTVYNLPHRALLTTPENIPVGTLATEDFETLDSFYDKVTKANYIDVAFSMDAKFLESYMAVAAY